MLAFATANTSSGFLVCKKTRLSCKQAGKGQTREALFMKLKKASFYFLEKKTKEGNSPVYCNT